MQEVWETKESVWRIWTKPLLERWYISLHPDHHGNVPSLFTNVPSSPSIPAVTGCMVHLVARFHHGNVPSLLVKVPV